MNMVHQACKPSALQFTDSFTTMFPIDGFKKLGDVCMHVLGGGGKDKSRNCRSHGGWEILSPACYPSVLSLPYCSFINLFSAMFLCGVIQYYQEVFMHV